MGQLKTRKGIFGALAVIGLLALFWLKRPVVPSEQNVGDRTNVTQSAIEALVERQAMQRQKSRDRRLAEQEVLQFDLPLDTEPQRQEFYDRLLKQSPVKLYHAWEGSLDSVKERHKGLLEVALADSLKLSADMPDAKAVYPEAAKFLADPNETESNKIRMVKWLGQSGTPEALAVLLDSLGSATKELKFEMMRQLAGVGNSRWDRNDSEQLSALLEAKWNETVSTSSPDGRVFGPLAQALAKVGNPQGVQLLLDSVSQFDANQDARAVASAASFSNVRNEASVSVLSAALSGQPAGSRVLFAAGEGLAGIGNEQATLGLIRWAQQANDEYAPAAEYLFSKLWHPVAIKKARHLFIENDPFNSQQVRAAVQRALASIQ